MKPLTIVDLGSMAYGPALELQRALARGRIEGRIENDVLLLVEHPPVVTLGRSFRGANLLTAPALLAHRGVEVFEVERGGDVTFHGPGQLVGYPILNLKHHRQDLHWYLRQVEESLIRALAHYGLTAVRHPGYTGVWIEGSSNASAAGRQAPAPDAHGGLRKIASIGVHARDWITWHGFALNVSTDLSYFDLIVPCGIPDVTMTSIAAEIGGRPDMPETARVVARAFADVFSLREEWRSSEWTLEGARPVAR